MANIDYAGLLTGISSQNQRPSPFTSPSRDQQLLGFAAKQNEALTGRLGGMFGQQQQDPVELAKTELQKLNPSDPDYQNKFIKLLRIADPAKAAELVERNKTIEAAGLRASSMAQALKTAGHEDLAKQVELGDVDAYKRGLELISPEKGKTSIEDLVDENTGVTHKVLLSSSGTILRTIGVSKMPSLKSVPLPNGQITWENEITGTRGDPQDTPEALEQEISRVEKLYSDLAAVDNVLSTVSEAKKLSEDESMTTGVFYNLASMPFATDARKLQTKITTLQSTLAFDRLQKMRDDSKTGGALGQVSNIELQLLQSSLTALDPIVGKEEFTKQLGKVQKHYTNFKKALLGEPLDIDWSMPEYKGKTTVVDGVRYMVDPVDPTKVFEIGKE